MKELHKVSATVFKKGLYTVNQLDLLCKDLLWKLPIRVNTTDKGGIYIADRIVDAVYPKSHLLPEFKDIIA